MQNGSSLKCDGNMNAQSRNICIIEVEFGTHTKNIKHAIIILYEYMYYIILYLCVLTSNEPEALR